jgi:hypothetical protein
LPRFIFICSPVVFAQFERGRKYETNRADSFPEYSTPFWGTTDLPGININTGKHRISNHFQYIIETTFFVFFYDS